MAQCVDVRRERFAASDRVLLDTNVVFDLVAPFGRPAERERREAYSSALVRARTVGAECVVSVLSFFELSGILEHDRYQSVHGAPAVSRRALKDFRTNADERRRFLRDLRSTWNDVRALATIAGVELLAGDVESVYLPLLAASTLDGYDPGIVCEARRLGISTIVTHDADFAAVPNLIVMTANSRLLTDV